MSWTEEKVKLLKDLWGSGKTASQIAEIIGGISRNAVIGKAHRLNLSAKIKTRTAVNNSNLGENKKITTNRKGRRFKFQSLLLDKNFEPAKNLSLEELNENTCKYSESDPDKPDFSFCGRKTVEKFSYCPLHLILIYQVKNKKEESNDQEEIPQYLEKKPKSA